MKVLKLILSFIIFLAVVTAIFCSILYFKGNKEKKDLIDAERKGTSGQYIKLSQGITHYELSGPDTGKVVILIHGFSVPYYIWDGTYQYLVRQGFRVLRYDMYGRGFSDRPDSLYNQQFYEQQLSDLINQLHLKTPVNLAGVSFGALVATNFTDTHPGLVDKLILVDPAYKFSPPASAEIYTRFDQATHGDEQAAGQLTDFKYPQRYPDWVAKYKVQMQYKGFRNALITTRYRYNFQNKEDNISLNNLHKPVLLIWGKEDHTVPFMYSDSLRSVLKCDFFPVDDAGHLPNIEQAEKVNKRIAAFLKE